MAAKEDKGLVGELEKGPTTRIRVAHSEYQGKKRIDIREFYEAEDGKWLPTKKGVSIREELFDEFKKLINKVKIS